MLFGAKPNLKRKRPTCWSSLPNFRSSSQQRVAIMGSRIVYHRIDTGDASPIRQPSRRLPSAKQAEMDGMLEDMKK